MNVQWLRRPAPHPCRWEPVQVRPAGRDSTSVLLRCVTCGDLMTRVLDGRFTLADCTGLIQEQLAEQVAEQLLAMESVPAGLGPQATVPRVPVGGQPPWAAS